MKFRFLFILLIVTGAAKAQQDVGGFFHLTAGISLPEGDFASTAPDNNAAGYAKNGFTFSALFGHKIHKRFGGFAMLSLAAHPTDNAALSRALNQNSNAYVWKAEKSIWSVTGFTFGPQYSVNFKKAAIDFRLSAGALNFISPEFVIQGTNTSGGPSATFTQKESRTSSLVIGGGASYKYEIKWGWVILVNADFFSAKPEFIDVEQITEVEGQNPQSTQVNFQQQFMMLQFGAGVGYVF